MKILTIAKSLYSKSKKENYMMSFGRILDESYFNIESSTCLLYLGIDFPFCLPEEKERLLDWFKNQVKKHSDHYINDKFVLLEIEISDKEFVNFLSACRMYRDIKEYPIEYTLISEKKINIDIVVTIEE